jgi:hypothetical protein
MARIICSAILCFFASSFVSAQNLVTNGSFLQGTTGWDSLLVGGPAKAAYSIANGVYTFKISTSGNESWNVQLKQRGIRLTQGDAYHFSFEAWAAGDREIEASVGMDNGPYTIYSSVSVPKFRLTATRQKFDVYFTMAAPTDSSARVQFNCGLAAIDVNLTNVAVEKVTTPMIVLLSPEGGEEWAGGSAREIRWMGVGMPRVSLSYSVDAGMNWTSIDDSALNTGSYSWLVPSVATAWCLVRVLDAGNALLGDTCAATFETGTFFNLVADGTFADSTSGAWQFGVYGNAAAHGSFSNGGYIITIDSGGSEPWHIQFTQSGIPMVRGETYVFSFDAYAAAPRPLMANIGQAGGAYLSFFDDTTRGKVTLDTTRRTFSIEFVASQPSDSNARIEFNAGTSSATVHIERVSLYHKSFAAMKRGRHPSGPGDAQIPMVVFGIAGADRHYRVPFRGLPRQADIIDLRGKVVRVLRPAGGNFFWDCRSRGGSLLGPGTYIVRIVGETGSTALPVVLPAR